MKVKLDEVQARLLVVGRIARFYNVPEDEVLLAHKLPRATAVMLRSALSDKKIEVKEGMTVQHVIEQLAKQMAILPN